MATREINLQFAVGRGERAQKCILRVTCRHRTLARRRVTWRCARRREPWKWKGRSDATPRASHAPGKRRREKERKEGEKRKKKRPRNYSALFAPRHSGCERRITRERNLSIFPVHEEKTAPAVNDIDFIRWCGKYICRVARIAEVQREKQRKRTAGLDRGSLKGIAREGIRERRGSRSVARADQVACARAIILNVSRDVVLIEE